MPDIATLFHFDDHEESFEDFGKTNGITLWEESFLMEILGYRSVDSFRKSLNRAKQACLTLGLNCEDHFRLDPVSGQHQVTRFGCYLLAMNGDPKKPEVAAAQAYFAAIAETFQSYIEHSDGMDRMLIRGEISDGQKSLSSTAKAHGVRNYAFFQNKGYLGMYNMPLATLAKYKGVPKKKIIDHMGKTEMAAHLFRITQTDEKIKRDDVRGQHDLEQTAFEVGREVRNTMNKLGGTNPEDLPPAEDIKKVKTKIKQARKKLQ